MPTIMLVGGYRIVVYPNDHRPAHVHVIGGANEALFYLHCVEGPPSLRENYGFRSGQLAIIETILREHLRQLCASWKEIHGKY